MSTPPSHPENKYQMVNTIAKKAKVLINHDTNAQLSQQGAIHNAMAANEKDEAQTAEQQPSA